jgi:hypothetical protein
LLVEGRSYSLTFRERLRHDQHNNLSRLSQHHTKERTNWVSTIKWNMKNGTLGQQQNKTTHRTHQKLL